MTKATKKAVTKKTTTKKAVIKKALATAQAITVQDVYDTFTRLDACNDLLRSLNKPTETLFDSDHPEGFEVELDSGGSIYMDREWARIMYKSLTDALRAERETIIAKLAKHNITAV